MASINVDCGRNVCSKCYNQEICSRSEAYNKIYDEIVDIIMTFYDGENDPILTMDLRCKYYKVISLSRQK